MRKKFGTSSGLSSKGGMQGIGSDPNYNPNGSSSGAAAGLDFNQISEVSGKAFDYVASSLAVFTEQVSKVRSGVFPCSCNH